MGAAILKTPELELSKDDSKKLSQAIQEVGKHYAFMFDPKKVAIANLCAVAGYIYGTRLVAWRARVSNEAAARRPAVPPGAGVPSGSGPQMAPNLRTMPNPGESAAPGGFPPGGAMPRPAAGANGPYGAPPAIPNPSDLWPEPAAEFPGMA